MVKSKNKKNKNIIKNVVNDIIDNIDNLVINETTIPKIKLVIRELNFVKLYIFPILNKTDKKYFLAHCPERVNPGDNKWNVENIPRIVGGINSESIGIAAKFYNSILSNKVKELSTIKNAEATKILENIFRDVNRTVLNLPHTTYLDLRHGFKNSFLKTLKFFD